MLGEKLLKIAGVATITGAVTLGAMTLWGGTDTLNQAKSTIQDYAQRIRIYESNENRMASKIQQLKSDIANLESQLADAVSKEEADQLRAQIADLQSQLVIPEANGETLAERIDALEIELKKANSEAAELQTVLDNNTTDATPLTEEEMTALIGEEEVKESQPYNPDKPIKKEEPQIPVIQETYRYNDSQKIINEVFISTFNMKDQIIVQNGSNNPPIKVTTNLISEPLTLNPGASESFAKEIEWIEITFKDKVYHITITR